MQYELHLLLGTAIGGLAVGVLVLLLSDRGDNVSAQMVRCSMGFTVAVVWIMAIADEVVNVLQTFGVIFGLSDAIIGLTIFAMGNSLADLVANMSVAVSSDFFLCFVTIYNNIQPELCPNDGILGLLRWTYAQHSPWGGYIRILCYQQNSQAI